MNMQTIIICYSLINILSTIVLFSLWSSSRKNFKGINYWFICFLIQLLSLPLIFLRGTLNEFLSVILPNTIYLLSIILLYRGLILFTEKKAPFHYLWGILTLSTGVHWWFTYITPLLFARQFNVSFFSMVLWFHCYLFIKKKKMDSSVAASLKKTGTVFLLFSCLYALRILVDTLSRSNTDFFTPGIFQFWTLMATIALQFLLTFSLFLSINRRLINNLERGIEQRDIVGRELRKFSRIVDQSPHSIIITDKKGKIEYVNPAFTTLSGFTFEESLGANPRILKSGIMPENLYKSLWNTIKRGGIWKGEILNKGKNGEYWWDLATISPLRDALGDVTHYLGIMENISDIKNMEKELIEARDQAETSERAKSRFLANMSHEIRTPMNSIIGYIDVVLDSADVSVMNRSYLKTARKSAGTLLALINDILDISKMEAGKLSVEKHQFNLHKLLKHVMQVLQVTAREKAIALNLHISEGIGEEFIGDEMRINQVLMNITGNAVKFTEEGSVEIFVKNTGNDSLLFEIRDTGIGMSEEQKNRIFEAFFQGDQAIEKRYGGTGLGTFISKQLIVMMGGDIWVDSEPGKGTVFCFTLPEIQGDGYKTSRYSIFSSQKPGPIFSPRAFKILVAEDIEENARLALFRLEQQNHKVTIAVNGEDVLHCLKEDDFDLILMDVHMPIMDGLTATRKIREMERGSQRKIPIIALTASVMEEDRNLCLEAGMDSVLGKPLHFDTLFEAMERAVPSERGKKNSGTEFFTSESFPEDSSAVVDFEKGLNAWGDEGIYREALKSFITDYSDFPEKIKTLMSQGEKEQVKTLVHTIKGLAGNLWILPLYDLISVIETSLKRGEWDISMYLTQIPDLLKSIAANTPDPQVDMALKEMPQKSMKQILQAAEVLKSQFKRGEYDDSTVVDFLACFQGLAEPGRLKAFKKSLDSFDFQKSLEHIDSLTEHLMDDYG